MINLTQQTLKYIENVLNIAIKNMPMNSKTIKNQYQKQNGIFELLPTEPMEIAEMIRVYNEYKYPEPTWITQYQVRETYGKHGTSIPKYVEDGRVRTKIEGDKTLYAEQDVTMFGKFDLLFSLSESKELVSNYVQPQLDLNLYVRYNMKQKGRDLDLGKLQVMNMLVNEFLEIAIQSPDIRLKLEEMLKQK